MAATNFGYDFDQIAKARITEGGNYTKPGTYVHAVRAFKFEKKRTKSFFFAELLVVKSRSTETDPKTGEVIEANAVGDEVACAIELSKDSAAGNIKAIVMGLLGMTEAEVDAEERKAPGNFGETIEELTNQVPGDTNAKGEKLPVNYARGMLIGNVAFPKENQGRDNPANKGKLFTAHRWTHVEDTPEKVTARRAAMDAKQAITS